MRARIAHHITVYDVLGWLAAGMQEQDIFQDYPDLQPDDIRACLAFAAERERRSTRVISLREEMTHPPSVGTINRVLARRDGVKRDLDRNRPRWADKFRVGR